MEHMSLFKSTTSFPADTPVEPRLPLIESTGWEESRLPSLARYCINALRKLLNPNCDALIELALSHFRHSTQIETIACGLHSPALLCFITARFGLMLS